MENKEKYLNKITKLCEARGWTYNQLTIEAELSSGMIYQWHNKKRNRSPSLEAIEKICKAFNISLSEFFADTKVDVVNDLNNKLLDLCSCLHAYEIEALIMIAETFIRNHK